MEIIGKIIATSVFLVASYWFGLISAFFVDLVLSVTIFYGNNLGNWNILSVCVWWGVWMIILTKRYWADFYDFILNG